MAGISHEQECIYIQFEINFYVDDIKLEDGKRGSRLSSQIYQEIMRHFKKTYLNCGENQELESQVVDNTETENRMPISIENKRN